jgi:hypothetical protein
MTELPRRAREIIDELYVLHAGLAKGDEEQRRLLTRKIAEQCRYELGERWGMKRPDPGRPPGKDSLAYNDPVGMVSWDWQNGTTRLPHEIPHFWSAEALTRTNGGKPQIFIPVDPVDHLNVHVPRPPAPPVEAPAHVSAGQLAAILERLDRIEQREIRCAELSERAAQAIELLKNRRYVASFLGIKVVSVPER